ncbi:HD domain-containing protein [Roseiconus lacunae]|uniref:HD domain-containing protein n=1 Tax=Roseiconus lacunae TaxID=2605694 RepID=UPI001E4A6DE9|nr:HD domain-containing protein [Roseiconus lacunae]MCD0458928.1 HD domain-containing protein [Roseiconus lacunae]
MNPNTFPSPATAELLAAVKFAAEKHADQRRKNQAGTPYINHPIEVAEHLAQVGNVTDTSILVAAILHDTVEDTDTSEAELCERFGDQVTGFVMECTDDKSLPKEERKRLQVVHAPNMTAGAKQIKLADKACNLRSLLIDPPLAWSTERQAEYFRWGQDVVAGLRGVNADLDADFETIIEAGQKKFGGS